VGTVTLENHRPDTPPQIELRFCVVDQAHRRTGVGRQLLRRAIERCRPTVVTNTQQVDGADAVMRLLWQLGFREYDRAKAGAVDTLADGSELVLTSDCIRYHLDK